MSTAENLNKPLDLTEQYSYLQKVSRTFALTIPLLDDELNDIISNTYLHLRIVDSIEDDKDCCAEEKNYLLLSLASFYEKDIKNEAELSDLLNTILSKIKSCTEDERLLIGDYQRLFSRTYLYDRKVQELIFKTVAIMCRGMAESVMNNVVSTQQDVDRYCYYVAGVVGEFLARLLCLYIEDKSVHEELIFLSVSFGEGLQLTNILKDRGEDSKRDTYFLPYPNRDQEGTKELQDSKIIDYYTDLTCGHLDNALHFLDLLPSSRQDFRLFGLFNVAMAFKTLKLIKTRNVRNKITRRQVYVLFFLSKLCSHSKILRLLFAKYLKLSLNSIKVDYVELFKRVTKWY